MIAPLRGVCSVHVVALTYSDAAIGTVTEITDAYSGELVLKVTGKTDAVYRPVVPAAKANGGTASALSEVVPISERLSIAVSEGDPGSTVNCSVIVREG